MIEIIKARMKMQGINQKQLSELTGIRQAAISQFISGKNRILSDALEKICDVLGLELSRV